MNTKRTFPKKEVEKKKEEDLTIPALFYNEFYKQLKLSNFDEYIGIVLSILDDMDDNAILKKILLGNISLEEKEKILEKQLWWEEKLSTWTEDKIEQNITNEAKKYIIQLLMSVIKLPNIDNSKKLELMQILNKLRK